LNQALKKRILMSPEQITAQVGIFFKNTGFELSSNYDPKSDYAFVADDFMPELTSFPRLQLKKAILPQCQSQVQAYIDDSFFKEEEAEKLLEQYYAGFNDFNLVDHYSSQYKNIYTMKVQDYLNIGFFIDTIVVEAYKQKFDLEKIREYLNFAIPQALKTVEQQDIPVHLDVSFSYSEKTFAIQISFQAEWGAFKCDLATIKKFAVNANFYDLVYFSKRKRLSFSAAWFKDPLLQNSKAYFFTETTAKMINEISQAELEIVEGPDQSVVYTSQKKAVSEQSKKLQLALKLAMFIKDYREKEEAPIEASSLQVPDIDNYLTKYPRQVDLNSLDEEMKNFITKLIRDDGLYQGVTEHIEKIAQGNLDGHVEEIQRVLKEKSLEDIADFLRIKGFKEENGDEFVTVSGGLANLSEEQWEVKRSEIVEQIKAEFIHIKSQGRNVVEDDILRVISNQLQTNPENLKSFVEGLVKEAVAGNAITKEKLEETLSRMIGISQPSPSNAQQELFEHKIERMKKIMLQMKNEVIKLKRKVQVLSVPSSSDSQEEEIQKLKRTLEKTIELARNEEKKVDKLNADIENIVQAKNHKIALLEMRIETIKSDFAASAQFASEENIEKLQIENKSLLARLELANRKINIINENMNRQDVGYDDKKDIEIVSLRTELENSRSVINQMKSERAALEGRIQDDKPDAKGKDNEQAIRMTSLMNEKKLLEEKLREQGMDLKKVEQKLKYAIAQLEEAQKKKGPMGGSSNKSNDVYIKQLEHVSNRFAEAASDLVEKKKELYKLRQENVSMNLKIAELEKKLSNIEKKAA